MSAFRRSRLWWLLGGVAVIGAGLLLRSRLLPLPPFVVKYGGVALWALMVFLACGILFPRMSTSRLALAAFGIACLVEVGQLYHAPWIDQIRATRLGALALGAVFNWPDIPAYALGVLTGALADLRTSKRPARLGNGPLRTNSCRDPNPRLPD